MPLKVFQDLYWNVSSTVVGPVQGPSRGGYPGWQASVVGGGLGGLQAAYERLRRWWTRIGETLRLARCVHRMDSEQRRVTARTIRALESPAYRSARCAVRETATTLGFSTPEAWVPYSRMIKADQGRAENIFRHVRACERTKARLVGSTLTHPEVNLVVELAYVGFAVKGRYFDGRAV